MREIRLSGSEGGGAGLNRLFLPLSGKYTFDCELVLDGIKVGVCYPGEYRLERLWRVMPTRLWGYEAYDLKIWENPKAFEAAS